jgi:hypothetical protein
MLWVFQDTVHLNLCKIQCLWTGGLEVSATEYMVVKFRIQNNYICKYTLVNKYGS